MEGSGHEDGGQQLSATVRSHRFPPLQQRTTSLEDQAMLANLGIGELSRVAAAHHTASQQLPPTSCVSTVYGCPPSTASCKRGRAANSAGRARGAPTRPVACLQGHCGGRGDK